MKTIVKEKGFTLVELLMVIAIIGILASVLIPAIGIAQTNAKIAASKVQLSSYVNAIELFKGQYKYYPFPQAHADGSSQGASISTITPAKFVGALSATNLLDGSRIEMGETNYGNRKLLSFYDFTESDFRDGDSSSGEIADRFNNPNIFIAIDGDGDGRITVPDPENSEGTKEISTSVTAYVKDSDPDTPDYYLYE